MSGGFSSPLVGPTFRLCPSFFRPIVRQCPLAPVILVPSESPSTVSNAAIG